MFQATVPYEWWKLRLLVRKRSNFMPGLVIDLSEVIVNAKRQLDHWPAILLSLCYAKHFQAHQPGYPSFPLWGLSDQPRWPSDLVFSVFFVKSLDSISFFCSLQVWVHGLPDYFDRNCLGLSYIWLCKFSCFLKQLVSNFENMLQVLKPLLGPFLARSVMPPINAILDKYCIWSHHRKVLYLITPCFFLHCASYIFTVTINMMIPGLPRQVFDPFHLF